MQTFERNLSSIDWSSLQGAYGPSDGTVRRSGRTLGDVAGALRTLISARVDDEDDRWNEAMDVLESHVWHQGDIYGVTPFVVPFVLELISGRSGEELRVLASYLANLAGSAFRYERSDDAGKQALGRDVNARIASDASRFTEWLRTELDPQATFLLVYTSGHNDSGFDALRDRNVLPFYGFAAMTSLDELPGWVMERAESVLRSADENRRLGAAALLASNGKVPERLRASLEKILAPEASVRLSREVEAAVGVLFSLEIPEVRAPADAPLVEAKVLVSRPNRLILRTADQRTVSMRRSVADLQSGDAVRVSLSPHGEIRVLEWHTESGEVQTRSFSSE